jgi:hypothetical protein
MTSLSVDKNSLLLFHSQYYSELTTVECTWFLSTNREVMLLSFHSQYYSELTTVKCTEFLSTDREVMLLLFHSQYYSELTTVKCTEVLSTDREVMLCCLYESSCLIYVENNLTSLSVDKTPVHSTVISSE